MDALRVLEELWEASRAAFVRKEPVVRDAVCWEVHGVWQQALAFKLSRGTGVAPGWGRAGRKPVAKRGRVRFPFSRVGLKRHFN